MTLELLRKQAVALLVLALGASSCATPDDNTDTSSDPSTTRSEDDPAGGGSSSTQDPTLTAENQSLFESRLDQATRLLGEGTPDALANARVAVDQALALSPNNSRARGLRSQILEAQGQDAENVQLPTYDDIQRVRAERNRVDVETRIEAAKNARDEGDYSAALRAINEAELAIDSDVPISLYQFSFAPSLNWSHIYPRSPEIQAYVEEITDRFDLRPHLRLNEGVESADWDESAKTWKIRSEAGTQVDAEVLIAALGQLNPARLPGHPGPRFVRRTDHALRPLGRERRSHW